MEIPKNITLSGSTITNNAIDELTKQTAPIVSYKGYHNITIKAESEMGTAIYGISYSDIGNSFGDNEAAAVHGIATKSIPDVIGKSESGTGVKAESTSGTGLEAISTTGRGIEVKSSSNEAIRAISSTGGGVIVALNEHAEGEGIAIYGKKEGDAGHAGFFEGKVWISGELVVGKDIVLANADCAEDFNIGNDVTVEPGTVMVLGENASLFPSRQAYDKRVAGVVSGAGNYKPGIVLDKQESDRKRQPIALLGKVYCKVDAQYGAIEIGDLLTTSPTSGHAMKVDDPLKAFGAVIGKALQPLQGGQGLIPVLIALQ